MKPAFTRFGNRRWRSIAGPSRSNRRAVDRIHRQYRVRISHGHGTDLNRLAVDLERVGIALHRRLEGQRPRIEARHAHIDRNDIVAQDPRPNDARGAIQGHKAGGREATTVE